MQKKNIVMVNYTEPTRTIVTHGTPSEVFLDSDIEHVQFTINSFSDYTKLMNVNYEGKYKTSSSVMIVRVQKEMDNASEFNKMHVVLKALMLFSPIRSILVVLNSNGWTGAQHEDVMELESEVKEVSILGTSERTKDKLVAETSVENLTLENSKVMRNVTVHSVEQIEALVSHFESISDKTAKNKVDQYTTVYNVPKELKMIFSQRLVKLLEKNCPHFVLNYK